MLKTEGKLVLVGAPDKPLELPAFPLILGKCPYYSLQQGRETVFVHQVNCTEIVTGRKMVVGSGIGGMNETQEMINFAAKHDIKSDIEVIPMDYVNTAMERVLKADVRYRFVIDIANTLMKAT